MTKNRIRLETSKLKRKRKHRFGVQQKRRCPLSFVVVSAIALTQLLF